MSDCKGVRSDITGHLQLHRCVTWEGQTLLGVMGGVGLGGIDGCLGGSGRRKACEYKLETVVASN